MRSRRFTADATAVCGSKTTIVVSGAIEVKARDTLRRVPRVRPRTPLPATTAKPAAQDELQTVEGYNAKQFKATASRHQALFDTFESRPCALREGLLWIIKTVSRMTEIDLFR
jgi:hypothetical protein